MPSRASVRARWSSRSTWSRAGSAPIFYPGLTRAAAARIVVNRAAEYRPDVSSGGRPAASWRRDAPLRRATREMGVR